MKVTTGLAVAAVLALGVMGKDVKALEMMVPNQAGGGVYITSDDCPDDSQKKIAYGRSGSGKTIFGCWFLRENMVWISWKPNGDLRTYPADAFIDPTAPTKPAAPARNGLRSF